RPEEKLAAHVRDVLLGDPRIIPGAKDRRGDTEAGTEAAVALIEISDRSAARGETGLGVECNVPRMVMPFRLPILAEHDAERGRSLLRLAGVHAPGGNNVRSTRRVRRAAAEAALSIRIRRYAQEESSNERCSRHGAPAQGVTTVRSRKRVTTARVGTRARSTGWVTTASTGQPAPGLVRRTATSRPVESRAAPSITMSYPAVGRAPSAATTTISRAKSIGGSGGGGTKGRVSSVHSWRQAAESRTTTLVESAMPLQVVYA